MASTDMAGSQAFWTEVYGHWPPTPEEVAAELHDWYVALHEVPKVYGEITGNRLTKPNTLAALVLDAAREDRGRDEAEARELSLRVRGGVSMVGAAREVATVAGQRATGQQVEIRCPHCGLARMAGG